MTNAGITARFSEEVAKDVNRQHAWTVQKNSRAGVVVDQKTAKTVVKKAELESPHKKIRAIAEKAAVWIARTDVKAIETASP